METQFSFISSFSTFFVTPDSVLIRGFLAAFERLGPGDERRRFFGLIEVLESAPLAPWLLGAGADSAMLFTIGTSSDERLEREDRDAALLIEWNSIATKGGTLAWDPWFLGRLKTSSRRSEGSGSEMVLAYGDPTAESRGARLERMEGRCVSCPSSVYGTIALRARTEGVVVSARGDGECWLRVAIGG